MVQVNQKVFNKKGEEGIITRIITKSTGYVEVSYNGIMKKEMALNLTDENGEPLRKAPKNNKRPPRELSPLEEIMYSLQSINGDIQGDRHSIHYHLWEERLLNIKEVAEDKGDDFIKSVCLSCYKCMRVSDKQAYCLAKFALENNVKI